jgi:UDP-GlcNAc:undecaprenyl-phosphate/decaprenyl-phosphate GlcNAc-1-phosphate transferase
VSSLEQTTLFYILLLIIPFIGVILITPLIIKYALNKNFVDQPGQHKTHVKPTPLLGGVSIFICVALTALFFLPVDDKILSLIIASVVLVITGLIDDLFNLKPLLKLFGQTIAASIVILWDISIFDGLINYFGQFSIPGFIVIGFIIGWIVLITNAFNLIDGVDGLSVGTAAIIFLAMAGLSFIEGGRPNIFGIQLIGAGACLGFLFYNFNPAKIYMGDTGSMLLGFILATVHLYVIRVPFSGQIILGSLFIFAFPVLDISYAIYRRLCKRCPLFQADKGHIHHILLSQGLSVRKTVIILYLISIVFAIIAISLLSLSIPARIILIIALLSSFSVMLLFWRLTKISSRNGLGI